jgi:Protein of unknown function (DUF2934)
MSDVEDKVRARAYEIWERQGGTGSPEDHWHQAERELKNEGLLTDARQGRSDPPEATVQDTPPVEAVKAVEAVDDTSRE